MKRLCVAICMFVVFVGSPVMAWSSATFTQGSIVTSVEHPVTVGQQELARMKQTSASTTAILGLVGFGDASIKSMAEKAGITKVYHVDRKVFSIWFFFVQETFTIYGE